MLLFYDNFCTLRQTFIYKINCYLMIENRSKNLPEINNLVLGKVVKITKHGIYAELIEYEGLSAYCHVREIAAAWIRNIRNFVRLDQQIVAKVLRVNRKTRQIDISMKRVSESQKKDKIHQYKNQKSAIAIVNLISKQLNTTPEKVLKVIEEPLFDEFGTLYSAFEYIAAEGEIDLLSLGLPEEYVDAIIEMSKSSIKIATYEKEVKIGLRSFAPDGVEQIRQVLFNISAALTKYDIEYEITSIGAPTYRLWVSGKFVEDIEDALEIAKSTLHESANAIDDLDYSLKIE